LIPLPDKTQEELTPAEATLLPLWKEVLGLSNTDLDADFFASGGHSLLGMRLLSSIQKNFGIALPLGKLFQAPTIRQLAKEFELQQQSAPLPVKPRSPRHLPWEKGVLNS
jgi:acyl carrier protein